MELAEFATVVGEVAVAVSITAAFVYWMIRRSVNVATKTYVKEYVGREISPIERKVEKAHSAARENSEDLDELGALIEGGNSTFDKGMMDYLDENIKRTRAIREDLEEIHRDLKRLKEDR